MGGEFTNLLSSVLRAQKEMILSSYPNTFFLFLDQMNQRVTVNVMDYFCLLNKGLVV